MGVRCSWTTCDKSNLYVSTFLALSFCLVYFSPSKEEEPADVRQEKLDLRLRYGVHHQRYAHRSQSDAAERHGVTTCTVSSRGRGEDRTAMTSPFPIFAANAGPTTTQTLLEMISLVCLLWPCFIFCSFLNYLYSISVFIYIISNYLFDGDGQCVKRKEYVCFELAKVTGEKENGVFIYK